MSEETPLQPPADPWADAIAAEEITPRILYAPADRGTDVHGTDVHGTDVHGADPDDTDIQDAPRLGDAGPGSAAVRPARPPAAERPVTDARPVTHDRPVTPGRRAGGFASRDGRAVAVLVAVAIVVLLAGIGVAVGWDLSTRHNTALGPNTGGSPSYGTPSAAPATSSTSASDGPASSSPSATGASPVDSARPTDPGQALKLTAAQATAELNREADEDGQQVAALAGHWVPQVSGKCVGLNVDIEPNWVPDGKLDTPHVTVQQILAMHLALHQRFEALTARPSQLGDPDIPPSGPCAGRTLWHSVVTTTFDSDTKANTWCDAHGLPVHECLARYVPKDGETAKTTERH